jgi:hypothetical protein
VRRAHAQQQPHLLSEQPWRTATHNHVQGAAADAKKSKLLTRQETMGDYVYSCT